MLEARNLQCIRGRHPLFGGLGLVLAPGQLLRVKGANGAGKTSLLRILCGLALPSEGEVLWRGQPIRKSREEFHSSLAWISHLPGLKDEFSAHENLAMNTALAGDRPSPAAIDAALARLGLAGRSRLPVRYLSQGQRRRAALARLFLSSARPLWILDEPFNALDARAVAEVEALLAAHAAAGGMVAYATHIEPLNTSGQRIDIDLDPPPPSQQDAR